jgi:hypothetical protein
MIELKEIEKLSPVKIVYTNLSDCNGAYSGAWRQKIPLIEIQKGMDRETTIICLLHEIGHAVCDKTKCRCLHPVKYPPNFLSEYHAIKSVLDFLRKHPDKKLIKTFDTYLGGIIYNPIFAKVVKKIRNLKRYKSLIDNHLGKS